MSEEHETMEPSEDQDTPAQHPEDASQEPAPREDEPARDRATPEGSVTQEARDEAQRLHQHLDDVDAEEPGLPRIPQPDEGGPLPPSPEEVEAATAPAAPPQTIRDRHVLKEYAGVYTYHGEATTFLGQAVEDGQRVDYRGLLHPEQLQNVKAAVEAGVLTKAGR